MTTDHPLGTTITALPNTSCTTPPSTTGQSDAMNIDTEPLTPMKATKRLFRGTGMADITNVDRRLDEHSDSEENDDDDDGDEDEGEGQHDADLAELVAEIGNLQLHPGAPYTRTRGIRMDEKEVKEEMERMTQGVAAEEDEDDEDYEEDGTTGGLREE